MDQTCSIILKTSMFYTDFNNSTFSLSVVVVLLEKEMHLSVCCVKRYTQGFWESLDDLELKLGKTK